MSKKFYESNRRSDKPGRREEDYSTCPFHEGTCSDIEKLEKVMTPRWVVTRIGGPLIVATFCFTAWVAIKSIGTAEHLVMVEARTEARMEAMSTNIAELMKHFNLTPMEPKPTPKVK